MSDKVLGYVAMVLAAMLGVWMGFYVRGEVDKGVLKYGVMAYGFYEKDNHWNRMRVDENGKVLCARE